MAFMAIYQDIRSMKIILESWDQYLKESEYITLDPSLIQPKFLNESLNEAFFKQDQEKDPQALSIQDIESTPPEEIQKIYFEMLGRETRQKKSARGKEFGGRAGKVMDLKKKIKSKKSGFLNFFKDKLLTVAKNMFKTKYISASDLEQEREEIKNQMLQVMLDEFTPLEREIVRAIFVFTGLNVPTVRDPERFKDEKIKKTVQYVNDGLYDLFKPTKETYQKAKVILQKLQEAPMENNPPVFRGYAATIESGNFRGLNEYSVGQIIDVGNIISFTTDEMTAAGFALDNVRVKPLLMPVLIRVPAGKLKRGVDVDEFSQFEGREEEVISAGKFKITDMGYEDPWHQDEYFLKMGMRSFPNIAKQLNFEELPAEEKIKYTIVVELEQMDKE